jgi:hypothetical protein
MALQTTVLEADGEGVWSWRPDAGAKFSREAIPAKVTGAKEPGPRGEREISRKTIAQGRPDDLATPVVLPRATFYARGPRVRAGTRSSLRPLL